MNIKIIEKITKKISGWSLKKQLFILFLISIVPILLSFMRQFSSTPQKTGVLTPTSIDTLIPTGFTLVPIEVQNADALDSMLGSKGIVNLLAPSREPGKSSRLLAQRVPILRAPLNPSHFAVLVPEHMSRAITQEPGPFWVVIQNPNQKGMSFEQQKQPQKRIKIIEGGVE